MNVPRLVIAGTHSGVGKTTVTLALLAALRARGHRVQPFKAGPDFIDPGHHTAVTGRPSRNLDGWMLGEKLNRHVFIRASADADFAVIEGMMGLFDGSSPVSEVGSTAEIAKQLDAPVLLVIDGSAMARSAAALVSGYAGFDPSLRVAGVLFNRLSGEGHYHLLKEAIEKETNVPVVGYLKANPSLTVPDRHLGLVTALEQGATALYERLAQAAAHTVNLDRVETLARSCGEFDIRQAAGLLPGRDPARDTPRIRVGVAHDPAFCFYYPENLELLQAEGGDLIRFSPLRDQALPAVDLLYLGGGYPELYGEQLAKNTTMRTAIRDFASLGGTIYAECGGMMYLTQAITDFEGRSHEMVGVFSAEAIMKKPGLTLGYREIEIARLCPLGPVGLKARGHEFHYSSLSGRGALDYACRLTDAHGGKRGQDGLIAGNTIALYAHIHFASQPEIPRALVASARTGLARRKSL
ncbi:MAG: cobyrinate a,c-diamide synthase [Nitrospiraceae bacterium]